MTQPMLALLPLFLVPALCACTARNVAAPAAFQGPAQTVYLPAAGRGPIVVVISGHSGPHLYQDFSANVAQLGYLTVLINGNDILSRHQDGALNLRTVIARAQASPHAVPGKAAVIGLSQGGGGALAHAAAMPELVSAVIAYYPQTNWWSDMRLLAERFRVPVLVLAGVRDRYHNCCLIESMRRLEAAARERQVPFQLVEYPHAGHGFNLAVSGYRSEDAADAWRRTTEMLARYQPLGEG